MKIHKYVGLDVHQVDTVVAVAEGGRSGEVRLYGKISSDLHAVEKALRKIRGENGVLHVAYEAGPTGFVLHRRLQQLAIDCMVVAPSRTPQPKSGRQKTNRRDALQLARLHRAGELTAIHVPDAVDESVRDLTRARSEASRDLKRAKQRLKSLLLRQGYHYAGKANWSEAHQRYRHQTPRRSRAPRLAGRDMKPPGSPSSAEKKHHAPHAFCSLRAPPAAAVVRDQAAGPCTSDVHRKRGFTPRPRTLPRESAGMTHHCTAGTQSTKISTIPVLPRFAPTHALIARSLSAATAVAVFHPPLLRCGLRLPFSA